MRTSARGREQQREQPLLILEQHRLYKQQRQQDGPQRFAFFRCSYVSGPGQHRRPGPSATGPTQLAPVQHRSPAWPAAASVRLDFHKTRFVMIQDH